MDGRGCQCARPVVWASEPGVCRLCHLLIRPEGVTASTWETALAMAEVALGRRRVGQGDDQGGP